MTLTNREFLIFQFLIKFQCFSYSFKDLANINNGPFWGCFSLPLQSIRFKFKSNSNYLIHKTREPSLWTAHYFAFVEIDLKDHTNQVLT